MPTGPRPTNPLHRPATWLPLLVGIALIVGILIGMQLAMSELPPVGEALPPAGSRQGKIEELIRYVEAKYVDEVDREALVQETIDHLLAQLDPHSNYIPREDLLQVNEQLDGTFVGIGVEYMLVDDTIVVVSPLAGGPSAMQGVRAGDRVVTINDTIVAGVDITGAQIVALLRGEKGTRVDIGVLRSPADERLDFTITRDEIPDRSVDVHYMLDDRTGYIKLNRFSATTYDEFMEALRELIDEHGMEDLVIDLRHNPGGYLQEATKILSQLFGEKGRTLVYTEGRAVGRHDYDTNGKALFDVDDIAVLIDEGSASASEIVAGAIQDYDRGILVGRRSFGKGLVQEQYRLKDGSALRLTVARYYTPSNRSIQRPYADADRYDADGNDRYRSGELLSADSIRIADSTEYYTANNRVVYGGGGITPDIFIPLDTVQLDPLFLALRRLLPEYVLRYVNEQPERFADLPLERFVRTRLSEAAFDDFLAFARAEGLEWADAELRPLRADLRRYLKARLARQLYGEIGFYTVYNAEDEAVLRALENLNSSSSTLRAER